MAPRYYTVTWDQLHRDAKALAWRLVDRGPWKGIVAITRGGLIPSAVIARELDCRLIGRQVMAVVNFPPRRIAGFESEVLVLGVPDESGAVVLLKPDLQVPNGGRMF